MKILFQTILILIFNSVAFGQNKGHQFDSLLLKLLERKIQNASYENDLTTSGFNLQKISKINKKAL